MKFKKMCCSQHSPCYSDIEHQAAEAVRSLALAELDFPAGAAAVTAKLVPLLQWSTLVYDQAKNNEVPRSQSAFVGEVALARVRRANDDPCLLLCLVHGKVKSNDSAVDC